MTTEPVPQRTSRTRRVVGAVVAVAAVAVLGLAIYGQRRGFSEGLQQLGWSGLVWSTLSAMVALCASGMAWRACLALVTPDHPLPLRPAANVFFLSQIGKYLPGSVWPVLAQMELTRRYGLPRAASGAGMLITMLVGIVTSTCAAIGALAVANAGALHTYWYVVPLLALGIATLTPPVLTPLLRLLGTVVRRPVITEPLTWRALGPAVLWSLAAWPLFGLHAWIIATDISHGDASFSLSTGAFALAWVVGFLVFFAPAGVGAREGVLLVVFSGTMSTAEALAFAVVSRVVLTVVDALAAVTGALLRRQSVSSEPPPV